MWIDRTLGDLNSFYDQGTTHLALGFSGGKDSTATLKIVYTTLLTNKLPLKLSIFYCDTGVEFPFARDYAQSLIKNVVREGRSNGLDISGHWLEPLPKHRFFVRVIGRGYPPPTNKFRWCTDKLRIRPVNEFLKSIEHGNNSIPVIGVRFGESKNRDRALSQYQSETNRLLKMRKSRRRIYAPIIDFDLTDVWEAIFEIDDPECIDAEVVAKLYRNMSGECPLIRDTKGKPCGAGRLGCWTCTVVRRDRAAENLVDAGSNSLKPLLEFRDWLVSIRDEKERRFPHRRNGQPSLGPFKLSTRKEILKRLREAEKSSGFELLTSIDEVEIQREWRNDDLLTP